MLGYALLISDKTKSGALLLTLEDAGWLVFPTGSIEDGLSTLGLGCVPDLIVVHTNRRDGTMVNRLRAVCEAPLYFVTENEVIPTELLRAQTVRTNASDNR